MPDPTRCPCGAVRTNADPPIRAYGFFGERTSVGIKACRECGTAYMPPEQLAEALRDAPKETPDA